MDMINKELVDNLTRLYQDALKHTDSRVTDYPLVWNDPRPVIGLILGYLLFVMIGPKIMSYLPPAPIPRWFLFVYNFALVGLSIYMFEEIVVGAYNAKYNFWCAEINRSTSDAEMRVTNALWWYYISKAIELLDTVWMILRKRNLQVTFLHVFHHATMLAIWWVVISWIPGGQSYFGSSLNCMVHVFMYSYYGLSVIPSLKGKLWWKKYITTIQLVQFMITFTHTTVGLYQSAKGQCSFPLWGQLLLWIYMIIMMCLFTNFFVHEYIKKTNDAKRKMQLKDINNNTISNGHHKQSKHVNGVAANGKSAEKKVN